MITPAQSARRVLIALLIGCACGVVYGFLRPVRKRHGVLADLVFSAVFFFCWLFVSFDICQADLRLGYTAALAGGVFAWECTFGIWLRPLFSGFWKAIGAFFMWIWGPFGKITKKFCVFLNFLFATGKKMGYNKVE